MSIQVKNLKHIYEKGMPGESVALEDITFSVEDGEFLGIIGHTGSGKSTLLQHLNGLLKPDEGTIEIGDTDITASGISMVEIRKRIGLVFQYPEYQLFEETVAKDVAFGPRNLGLGEEEIEERVREAIELVGLDYEKFKDRSPFELSGGQKRRVAIAGVIAMRPEVLILDEPTAGLDPKGRDDILNQIAELKEKTGMTVVLVSHSMEDVAKYVDRLVVMDHGKKAFDGTPKEVFAQYKELEEIGLAAPQVTYIMHALAEHGMNVKTDATTIEEAATEIMRSIHG